MEYRPKGLGRGILVRDKVQPKSNWDWCDGVSQIVF